MKTCKKCGIEKEDSEYSSKYSWCRACCSANYHANKHKKDKEKKKTQAHEYYLKRKNKAAEVNTTMPQPEITQDTLYYWKLNKQMIILLDENDNVVRRFKSNFVQDEDFVTNIRIEIVLRFGIAPKNLKE